jgi:hypothetical protein
MKAGCGVDLLRHQWLHARLPSGVRARVKNRSALTWVGGFAQRDAEVRCATNLTQHRCAHPSFLVRQGLGGKQSP